MCLYFYQKWHNFMCAAGLFMSDNSAFILFKQTCIPVQSNRYDKQEDERKLCGTVECDVKQMKHTLHSYAIQWSLHSIKYYKLSWILGLQFTHGQLFVFHCILVWSKYNMAGWSGVDKFKRYFNCTACNFLLWG